MNWNPVLNKFIEIKNEYINKIGEISYSYTSKQTCLERWIEELNNIEPINQYQEYRNIVSCLELNQYNNGLLIRYGRYSNIYNGEVDDSPEDFWNKYNGFYRECRSLVIDVEKNCIILSPMKKFFNINEIEETTLENIQRRIDKAKIVEFSDKLDGSMQSARWYNNALVVAGSQAINPDNSWRLRDGYRMIYELAGYKKMLQDYPDYTFIFEYISLKDAHVVKYTKEQEGLYLISIRDVNTGKEVDYKTVISFAEKYNIPTTKIFNKTLSQVMSELDDKTSDEAEGFVINIDGYKVKLKYNDYCQIHRILSKTASANVVIKSIADGTYDDLISKLPMAYHDNVQQIATKVINYISFTEKKVQKYYNSAPKNDKKQFMLYIDQFVPIQYRNYCKELYFGHTINVIKSGNDKSPHYKKLKEMEITHYE